MRRLQTTIYDPSKEDQNIIKNALTTSQGKVKTNCLRRRQSLCTHPPAYSQTNTTISLWLPDEQVCSSAELSFPYVGFLYFFNPESLLAMSLMTWGASERGLASGKRVSFDQTEGCPCQPFRPRIFILPHAALMARGEFQTVLLLPVTDWMFPVALDVA